MRFHAKSNEEAVLCSLKASIDRIQEILGYEPGLRLSDGLAEALDWYTRTSGAASA